MDKTTTHYVIAGNMPAAEASALLILSGKTHNLYTSKAMVLKAWDMYPDPLANWHKPYEVVIVQNEHGDIRSIEAQLLVKEQATA